MIHRSGQRNWLGRKVTVNHALLRWLICPSWLSNKKQKRKHVDRPVESIHGAAEPSHTPPPLTRFATCITVVVEPAQSRRGSSHPHRIWTRLRSLLEATRCGAYSTPERLLPPQPDLDTAPVVEKRAWPPLRVRRRRGPSRPPLDLDAAPVAEE